MIHIKISCDECGTDYDTDCKGLVFFAVDPKDQPNPGVLRGCHSTGLAEVIGPLLKWITDQVMLEMQKADDALTTERLMGQINDLEEKLKSL